MTPSGLGRLVIIGAVLLAACGAEQQTVSTSALEVEEFEVLDPVLLDDETVQAIIAGTEAAPEYSSDPPTSGARSGDHARCGIYREPIPDLYQVASLARGAVLVQYQSRLPADARDAVEQAVRDLGDGVIAAPHEALPAPVVVTGWGKMLRLGFADPDRISEFVKQYGGQGPSNGECPATVDDT